MQIRVAASYGGTDRERRHQSIERCRSGWCGGSSSSSGGGGLSTKAKVLIIVAIAAAGAAGAIVATRRRLLFPRGRSDGDDLGRDTHGRRPDGRYAVIAAPANKNEDADIDLWRRAERGGLWHWAEDKSNDTNFLNGDAGRHGGGSGERSDARVSAGSGHDSDDDGIPAAASIGPLLNAGQTFTQVEVSSSGTFALASTGTEKSLS